MRDHTTRALTNREMITCDDCGRRACLDTAARYEFTCPAPRTAYICSRCERGETEFTRVTYPYDDSESE